MSKYQIRFVSRKTFNLHIKTGYKTKIDAEKDLEKNGFVRHGEVWQHPNWWAKIWEEAKE